MPITISNSVIPHSPQVFGDQTTPVTTALPNGGYVIAWTDAFGSSQRDVKFQIYNGLGEPVGGVQLANSSTLGNQVVRDVVATADGKFTILWATGSTLTARAFDGTTGAATSPEANLTTLNGLDVSGAQMIATGASTLKVQFTSNTTANSNTALEQSTFNTATGLFSAKFTVTTNLLSFLPIVELDPGNGSEHYALVTDGSTAGLVNGSGAGNILSLPTTTTSVTKIQENAFLLFGEAPNGVLSFSLLTGFSSNIVSFTASPAITLTGVGGSATSQDTFAKTTVDLGGGRILALWVAEGGVGTTSVADGVFAVVFNTITRSFEDGVVRISSINAASLADVTLDAQVMADGRVTLAVGVPSPLFANFNGSDVASFVIDPRISGVTVTGTGLTDSFIGSAFADTFNNIGANDVINGGNGTDTVVLAANVARSIDLINADRFAGAPSNLTSIEIMTMGDLDDVLYGLTTSDTVNGSGGNDILMLRDGADTADGGAGNDTIHGAAGADNLQGGIGNDILSGGADNDNLNGGADSDNITGGEGNDFIQGGDGVDRLYGNGGDDNLDGGAGADFISGGAGNDMILGGADNDTIAAGEGDDLIDAGAGNDFINAGAGFNTVDGGIGTDTISYSQVAALAGQAGVYIDLDPSADPFGNTDGVLVEDDILVNVENVIGGNGDDFIYGNALGNTLRGLGGNDTLMGRGNNDTLIGGAGSDRFVFEAVSTAGNDLVRDFTIGQDKVLFVSAGFGNIAEGNIAASFVANAAGTATIAAAQFIMDNAGAGAGRLFYDADGTGAGVASLITTITFTTADGATVFGAGDFLFA